MFPLMYCFLFSYCHSQREEEEKINNMRHFCHSTSLNIGIIVTDLVILMLCLIIMIVMIDMLKIVMKKMTKKHSISMTFK